MTCASAVTYDTKRLHRNEDRLTSGRHNLDMRTCADDELHVSACALRCRSARRPSLVTGLAWPSSTDLTALAASYIR